MVTDTTLTIYVSHNLKDQESLRMNYSNYDSLENHDLTIKVQRKISIIFLVYPKLNFETISSAYYL